MDTTSAWIGKYEIVSVTYRPDIVPFRTLVETAKQHACATRIWTTTKAQLDVAREIVKDDASMLDASIRPAKDSDQLYYLERSAYRFLPLTPLQARRVNGALYTKKDAKRWLSPRQLELLKQVESMLSRSPNALDGLKRPRDLAMLDEYQAKVAKRVQR